MKKTTPTTISLLGPVFWAVAPLARPPGVPAHPTVLSRANRWKPMAWPRNANGVVIETRGPGPAQWKTVQSLVDKSRSSPSYSVPVVARTGWLFIRPNDRTSKTKGNLGIRFERTRVKPHLDAAVAGSDAVFLFSAALKRRLIRRPDGGAGSPGRIGQCVTYFVAIGNYENPANETLGGIEFPRRNSRLRLQSFVPLFADDHEDAVSCKTSRRVEPRSISRPGEVLCGLGGGAAWPFGAFKVVPRGDPRRRHPNSYFKRVKELWWVSRRHGAVLVERTDRGVFRGNEYLRDARW